MPLREQRQDHLGARVVGIGHQDHAGGELAGDLEEELHQPVEQRAPQLAGAVDHALVDAGRQGNGGDVSVGGLDEQGQGLEGVTVDELGLRVVRGLLMELFHRRHLPALLRDLESVRQADQRLAHLHGVEASPAEANPQRRQRAERERLAVEQGQEPQVALRAQRQGPHEARDAREIGPHAQSHQDDPHPLEGGLSGAGGSQGQHAGVPHRPQFHGSPGAAGCGGWRIPVAV
jgi:hypothetical protein